MPEGWAWQYDMSMIALERGYRVEITVTFTITLDKLASRLKEGVLMLSSVAVDRKRDSLVLLEDLDELTSLLKEGVLVLSSVAVD